MVKREESRTWFRVVRTQKRGDGFYGGCTETKGEKGMMRVEISDGSGWVNLSLAKRFNGYSGDLFRVLSGSWVLKTASQDREDHYQRITQEEAHAWLVRNGHYPCLATEVL